MIIDDDDDDDDAVNCKVSPRDIDVRSNLSKMDETSLVREISRVQAVLQDASFCGKAETSSLVALPVISLPVPVCEDNGEENTVAQHRVLLDEALRVADLLEHDAELMSTCNGAPVKTLVSLLQKVSCPPSGDDAYSIQSNLVEEALTLARKLVQDAIESFGGREPLYCVCRRPYMDSMASLRCYRCNDWFHLACVNIDPLNMPKKFLCPFCDGSMFVPHSALRSAPLSLKTTPTSNTKTKKTRKRSISQENNSFLSILSHDKPFCILSEKDIKEADIEVLVCEVIRTRFELQNINVEFALCTTSGCETKSLAGHSLVIDRDIVHAASVVPSGQELASEINTIIAEHGVTYTDIARQADVPGGRRTTSDFLRGKLNQNTFRNDKMQYFRRWLFAFREAISSLSEFSTLNQSISDKIPRGATLFSCVRNLLVQNFISIASLGQQAGLSGGQRVISNFLRGVNVPYHARKEKLLRRWLQEYQRQQLPALNWEDFLKDNSIPEQPPIPMSDDNTQQKSSCTPTSNTLNVSQTLSSSTPSTEDLSQTQKMPKNRTRVTLLQTLIEENQRNNVDERLDTNLNSLIGRTEPRTIAPLIKENAPTLDKTPTPKPKSQVKSKKSLRKTDAPIERASATSEIKRRKSLRQIVLRSAKFIDREFRQGDVICTLDLRGQVWYRTTVLKVRDNELYVHYWGWKSTHDEWVPIDETRIKEWVDDSQTPSRKRTKLSEQKKSVVATTDTLKHEAAKKPVNVCITCHRGGKLTACNICPNAYHQQCLNKKLSATPKTNTAFFCPVCAGKTKRGRAARMKQHQANST